MSTHAFNVWTKKMLPRLGLMQLDQGFRRRDKRIRSFRFWLIRWVVFPLPMPASWSEIYDGSQNNIQPTNQEDGVSKKKPSMRFKYLIKRQKRQAKHQLLDAEFRRIAQIERASRWTLSDGSARLSPILATRALHQRIWTIESSCLVSA